MNKKWIGIAALSVTTLTLFGFGKIPAATLNGRTVQQPSRTYAQYLQDMSKVQEIYTPNGSYIRTDKMVNLPADKVTNDKNELLKNPNIQEIVLPYGIFIKATPEEVKTHQLNFLEQAKQLKKNQK